MLEIKDLRIRFHTRERDAVGGISLTVNDGEILGLVGESGSGKTVTAMAIGGLLDRAACDVSGQILLDGTDLLTLDSARFRKVRGKTLGVVFQDPSAALDPLMKAGRQAEEALLIHTSMTKKERKEAVLQAFEAVELRDPERVYDSYPHELSGGMQQRVMIAAALVTNPSLILLDEPTTALDAGVQAEILALLKRLNAEKRISMLLISHDLSVVRRACRRVAVMQRGSIVEEGEAEALFSSPAHPYTKRLLEAIPLSRLRRGCGM